MECGENGKAEACQGEAEEGGRAEEEEEKEEEVEAMNEGFVKTIKMALTGYKANLAAREMALARSRSNIENINNLVANVDNVDDEVRSRIEAICGIIHEDLELEE